MKKRLLFFVFCFLMFAQINAQTIQNEAEQKWVKKQFRALNMSQKIAQLMIIRAHSAWNEKQIDTLAQIIKKYNVGGLCFFQGGPVREAMQTNYYQSIAKTPLLITMDAEWGVGMRLDSVEMFPRQLLMGAISNDTLIYQMGAAIAAQCKRLGIQVNYAPDVDINNNPSNPVINDRSFGQNKERVIQHGLAYMRGLQDNGVMATAKHFPGHGDVNVDSHLDIPIIKKSKDALDSLELAPFKALIKAGVGSVMVAHLSVPSIDSTPKFATSLSPKAVNDLLKTELGFKGLTVTDALEMKAISNYFPNSEANVQAILAGNDMLCLPANIPETIKKIKSAIKEGRITKEDINERVIKVLTAKYRYGLANKLWIDTTNIIADLNSQVAGIKAEMAVQSLTYCNAQTTTILDKKIPTAYIALNCEKPTLLTKSLDNQYGVKVFYIGTKDSLSLNHLTDSLKKYQQVIVGLHNYNRRPANHFQINKAFIHFLNEAHPTNWTHIILGNPYAVGEFNKINNILFAYEDNDFSQKAVLNWLEGKVKANGKLPVTVSDNLPYGTGNTTIQKLAAIDTIVMNAIEKKAIPGCQILVAKDNEIVFNKAYGTTAGEGSTPVTLNTYYDLASVTKVAATTVSIMKLVDEGKIDINKTIGDYLPWVKGNAKAKITLKDLLLHQAGLFPYIKFYESLLQKNGTFKPGLVSNKIDQTHHQFISPNKYLIDTWMDTIQTQILKSPITEAGKYVYSDNDFIFLGKIIEKVTGMSLQAYSLQEFYKPMGMSSTDYLPLEKTTIDNIAATELDDYFRKELIRGSVHDEGASTMGGIAGHAGLFSNATDLAKLYLMLMNKGSWNGQQYIKPSTVAYFTAYQNESRRGLGFDKPEKNNQTSATPYPSLSVSPSTFGHTGFTGTCVWADPEKGILYIFLSNRVFPTRDNKAFSALNLRPTIQEVVYKAFE
jgi:beta-glucosidase-like glycosyl hydrolase/CubicO group peptidase (beta-lactamase class C family)